MCSRWTISRGGNFFDSHIRLVARKCRSVRYVRLIVSSVNEQLILTVGLVRDDEGMHAERLKLWEEFNTCWLSALQKQRELSLQVLDTGQRPHPPSSLMESDQMENMGKELVRLCDIMEKHGLVDYQMGVWEEEIITRKFVIPQVCEHLSN